MGARSARRVAGAQVRKARASPAAWAGAHPGRRVLADRRRGTERRRTAWCTHRAYAVCDGTAAAARAAPLFSLLQSRAVAFRPGLSCSSRLWVVRGL